MTPATYNLAVVRGSAGPTQGLVVRLKTRDLDNSLINMLFDDVRLSIYDKPAQKITRQLLIRATLENGQMQITDEYSAEVSWVPTAEETRKLLIGEKNYYELEVRSGTDEIVYLIGVVNGIGGLNDDEDAVS